MNEQQIITKEDVRQLKESWSGDPGWDIEDTPGYEAFREDLLAFSNEKKAQWKKEREAELQTLSELMGVPGNLKLAAYLNYLERRVHSLESPLD